MVHLTAAVLPIQLLILMVIIQYWWWCLMRKTNDRVDCLRTCVCMCSCHSRQDICGWSSPTASSQSPSSRHLWWPQLHWAWQHLTGEFHCVDNTGTTHIASRDELIKWGNLVRRWNKYGNNVSCISGVKWVPVRCNVRWWSILRITHCRTVSRFSSGWLVVSIPRNVAT